MSELERRLAALAPEIDWPETPALRVPSQAPAGPRRKRVLLVPVLAALAALAVAFAVPGARSAILRALHLEGVTIERVDVLPPAQERPLGSGLGRPATSEAAARALGRPVALPRLDGQPTLHLQGGVVSILFADPDPVLLSEFRTDAGEPLLRKLVGASTHVTAVRIGGAPGFWISGGEHLYLSPAAPPRLAGNVLVWAVGGLLYRLEGHGLAEHEALRLAAEIGGT